jgi:hypothetical protein
VLKYSYLNTKTVTAGNSNFVVHREHAKPEVAAKLLKEITERNGVLINHLQMKYSHSNVSTMNPEKEGRIDIIPPSGNTEEVMTENLPYLMSDMTYLSKRVVQLKSNYQVNNISEISPLNPSGSTSYTENKGEKLVLCLRNKNPNAEGIHEFHDMNLIMFVVLHEMTHIMNDRWGHKMQFWALFKFVLQNAAECGIYTPIDYRKKPENYCGMDITYNPFYDPNM